MQPSDDVCTGAAQYHLFTDDFYLHVLILILIYCILHAWLLVLVLGAYYDYFNYHVNVN